MAATFIKINDTRLIKSSIKRYIPNGSTSLNVYYNPSRNKLDVETFTFSTKKLRDDMIAKVDAIFL